MGISKKDAYETLGLPFGSDSDAIKKSYKSLALQWHPDKHKNSPNATQKFQDISTAYKRLTDDEVDSDDEVEMTLNSMFELFQQIFLNKPFGGGGYSNGYNSSGDSSSDEDEDEDDDDDVDYPELFANRLKTKHDFKGKMNINENSSSRRLTAEEIEKNANELITEEEKEKRKAEKRRAKKKRRREKKRQEKIQAEKGKKDGTGSKTETNGETRKSKKDKKSKDSSGSEDDFDQNAAFFTKVVSKKKKQGVLTEGAPSTKSKNTNKGQKEEESEELDPVVLRSRQLAIRGNQMANQGAYSAAIDLFSEAIKLDPKDFRFFGNRSYCFDRIAQYERALKDADRAIILDPDWPKGYFRKGRALAGLKLYADAEQAFMQVLKLDRNCEDAMEELMRVRTHQLTEMGFSKQQAEAAIKQYGSVQQALDSLLAGVVAENSLAGEVYMSDEEEFSPSLNIQPVVANDRPADIKMDPTNPEGLTALWVGNVLPEVTDKRLTQMFSRFGTVTSVRCLPEKYCAFINFKTKEAAGMAMHHLQGMECAGQRLLIKFPDNPILNGGNVVLKKPDKPLQLQPQQPQQQPPTITTTTQPQQQQPQQQNPVQPTKSFNVPRPASPEVPLTKQEEEELQAKQSGPVNGDECYFWRTTGCNFGKNCKYKHVPEHKGVDKKPWQKVK